jgi:arsenite oxidase large subunit
MAGDVAGLLAVQAEGHAGKPDLKSSGGTPIPNALARWIRSKPSTTLARRAAYLINNGRANHVWQSAYLDQASELIVDRSPYPYVELHPDDMADLGVAAGDLVEIYNDVGSTQAMVYPTPTARRKEAFMVFAHPLGVQGNVVSGAVNELLIPNYKQTWADIRRIAAPDAQVAHVSFKSFQIPVAPE